MVRCLGPVVILHFVFLLRFASHLKASPLPPAPLAVAGFMVAGLVAWQYYDRLAGLFGFVVWFLFR